MFTLLRTSFLLSIFALTVSAASEENINKQIEATSGGKLVVDVEFGTIDVAPGTDNQVALEAQRKIDFGDEAKEKEYFSAIPVTITKDGNVITVRARASKQKNWWNGYSKNGARNNTYLLLLSPISAQAVGLFRSVWRSTNHFYPISTPLISPQTR